MPRLALLVLATLLDTLLLDAEELELLALLVLELELLLRLLELLELEFELLLTLLEVMLELDEPPPLLAPPPPPQATKSPTMHSVIKACQRS